MPLKMCVCVCVCVCERERERERERSFGRGRENRVVRLLRLDRTFPFFYSDFIFSLTIHLH